MTEGKAQIVTVESEARGSNDSRMGPHTEGSSGGVDHVDTIEDPSADPEPSTRRAADELGHKPTDSDATAGTADPGPSLELAARGPGTTQRVRRPPAHLENFLCYNTRSIDPISTFTPR